MSLFRFSLALGSLLFFSQAQTGQAQISKAHQILINRGLQIQGLVQPDDNFDFHTYTNANYTALKWLPAYSPNEDQKSWNLMSRIGAAPGFPWGRWMGNPTVMPPLGGEAPYMSQLVSLSFSDEPNLYDSTVFNNMANWFTSTATTWPNTIRYINNWGGQIEDWLLSSFIRQARPDLISFDTYPWKCVYDLNMTNHIGAPIGGPPTVWYSELRRYRAWASTYNIPFGIYRQTFHAVEDYSPFTVYRNPSASELRLNTFAALAFDAKMLIDFTYNSGASCLFERYYFPDGSSTGAGDNYPNALYTEQSDINLRARNLGKALVLLKPINDLHNPNDVNPPPGPASGNPNFPDGYCTSIMFVRGKYLSGGATNLTALPNSFLEDPDNVKDPYSWWEYLKNDPYLNGWSVTNSAGLKNDGLPGEVILSWFKPLDPSFTATNATNQVYMMVVNALVDTNGTPAQCAQTITLDFNFPNAGTNGVVFLDPATGQLQTNAPLPLLYGTKRRLTLTLNGGDAALFKIHDGTPFVGFYPIPARMGLQKEGNTGALSIQGTAATRYRVETAAALPSTNWTVLTNLLLPSSTYLLQDTRSNASQSFYRAIGTP